MTQYNNPTPIAVHLQEVKAPDGSLGIIVIKRSDNGGWALPGGYMEVGKDESAETAAAREFHEETGLVVEPGEVMGTKVTPAGKLMLFCRSKVRWEDLDLSNWQPTDEATAIDVVFQPDPLCFPTHEEALREWFLWRCNNPVEDNPVELVDQHLPYDFGYYPGESDKPANGEVDKKEELMILANMLRLKATPHFSEALEQIYLTAFIHDLLPEHWDDDCDMLQVWAMVEVARTLPMDQLKIIGTKYEDLKAA